MARYVPQRIEDAHKSTQEYVVVPGYFGAAEEKKRTPVFAIALGLAGAAWFLSREKKKRR